VWHVLDATLDRPGTAMRTCLRPGAQACTVSTRSGAVCVRGFVFLGVCCLSEIGAGLSRVSMPPLMIACSSIRGAPTVFKCVWHVLDATLDKPGTAMRTCLRPGAQACTVSTRSGAVCVRGFVFLGVCCLSEIGAGLSRVSMLPLVIVCSSRRGAPTVFKCVWHVSDATLDRPGTAMRTCLRPGAQACTVSTRSGAVCVRGFVFLGVCCLSEIGAGLSRVSMLPLVIVCSCRRGAPTVFKCVWHVLDATLDQPSTAMRTRTPLTSRVLGALPRGAGQDRVLRACTAPNQGSEGQRQERAGCTEHQSRESGFRARLCSQNQGSQGRLRVIPGFIARHCSQTRVHRAFPGLEKRQTRVPRGRKEANKGSQGSRRGKQGCTAV